MTEKKNKKVETRIHFKKRGETKKPYELEIQKLKK